MLNQRNGELHSYSVHLCQEKSKYLQFDNNANKNEPLHTVTWVMRG